MKSPLQPLVAIAFVIVALLAFVVIIATIEGVLNATAVIATLGSVLSGVVAGIVYKVRDESSTPTREAPSDE